MDIVILPVGQQYITFEILQNFQQCRFQFCLVAVKVNRTLLTSTRHRANILHLRYVARTPPVAACSPGRRSNVENAPRRRPVTDQQRAHPAERSHREVLGPKTSTGAIVYQRQNSSSLPALIVPIKPRYLNVDTSHNSRCGITRRRKLAGFVLSITNQSDQQMIGVEQSARPTANRAV